jgi:hypothetical protein
MINPAMTTKLLTVLKGAERRFGDRVPGWRIRPVLVHGFNFPETTANDADKSVQVRVTASTTRYPMQAAFQLSHEAIHCLAPACRRDTIWFEEGLANHFSLTFPEISAPTRAENERDVPNLFVGPLKAFRDLKATDEQIRALRSDESWFDRITPDLIQKHFSASAELAKRLCQRLPIERPNAM